MNLCSLYDRRNKIRLNRIISWLVSAVFILFAYLNINDSDWFIWIPIYLCIGLLPFSPVELVNNYYLKTVAVLVFILALLLIFGFLNTIMPAQIDNRMVNMSEHQREGVGLILGSIWLWFSRLLIGSKTS